MKVYIVVDVNSKEIQDVYASKKEADAWVNSHYYTEQRIDAVVQEWDVIPG